MAGTSTSGNYGHLGRPGQVGGSIPARGRSAEQKDTDPKRKLRDQPLCPTLEEMADQRGMDLVYKSTRKKKKKARRPQRAAA